MTYPCVLCQEWSCGKTGDIHCQDRVFWRDPARRGWYTLWFLKRRHKPSTIEKWVRWGLPLAVDPHGRTVGAPWLHALYVRLPRPLNSRNQLPLRVWGKTEELAHEGVQLARLLDPKDFVTTAERVVEDGKA